MAKVHRIGLTQLSANDAVSDSHDRVNIVFVHGLRGHPQETWSAKPKFLNNDKDSEPSSKRTSLRSLFNPSRSSKRIEIGSEQVLSNHDVFWPCDFLDHDLPTSRIWTYGYNADVIGMFESNNKNSVTQHGRDFSVQLERDIQNEDPLIFVVHSLGGIIVKDAIRRSQIVRSRTRLVLFLGTPHRGSNLAAWGAIASRLARLALLDSNPRILEALKVDSEVFDIIQEEFRSVVLRGEIKVHSFQEARGISGVRGLSGKVVDDFSSKLDLGEPFETVETMDANHMQMTRCSTKDDPQYRAVLGVLRQSIRSGFGTDKAGAQPTWPSLVLRPANNRDIGGSGGGGEDKLIRRPCYYIQLPKNPRFTGRAVIIDKLKEACFAQNQTGRVALVGLGGVGKTQVALQFVYWVKENRSDYSIFWVPILSGASVEQAYVEIAKKLGVRKSTDDEDIKELVYQHLSSEEAGSWLLVLDNADDHEMVFGSMDQSGIEEYIPQSENGLILLTTRSRQVAVDFAQSSVIDLEQMDHEEGYHLLEISLIQKQALQDETLTTNLLDRLEYLPLAITQAAAYLNQTRIPIRQYLDLLQGAEKDVARVLGRAFRDSTRYRNSQNAVATTWVLSFAQLRKSNQTAVDLLSFISCIEPKAIPQSILPNTDEEELIWAIGNLCGYSFLVRRGDSNMFDMHSLVHVAARLWLEEQGKIGSVLEETIRHLGKILMSSDQSNRDIWREYVPHAFRVLDRSKDYELKDRYVLAGNLGDCLDADRRFKEAIICYEEVCNWKRKELSEDDNSRLNAEQVLAIAYLENRQIEDAIKIMEHALTIRKETLDEKNYVRLKLEHNLARAYFDNRQIEKSNKMLEHVVAIQKEMLHEKDHFRLVSEQTLAVGYLENRQIKEAIKMLEHVVAIQKETLDEKDHYRLLSEHTLAKAYHDNMQIEESIKLVEHVVAIQKETLDEKDHSRLIAEQTLASAYLENRQIEDAIKIIEHVVAIVRETLDEKDHERLSSEHTLSLAYFYNMQIEESIKISEHVVRIRNETLDEKDHFLLLSCQVLASAYLKNGQVKDAIKIMEHVVAIQKETLDEKDHVRVRSQQTLAQAYLANMQIEESIKLYEHVVAIQHESLDEKDRERLTTGHNLASAYIYNRQIKKAIKVLEYVVAVRKEILDEKDNDRLVSEHNLAIGYLENRQIEEAIELLEHVAAIRKETRDEKDIERLVSEHNLARAYLDNRQIEKSIKMLEQVVAIQKEILDGKNHSLMISEHTLARAYLDNKQIEEAIKMLEHVVAIRKETLDEKNYSRLTSEHTLARAYLINSQIEESIKLLEHVVAIQKEIMDEEDNSRLTSEHTLARAYLRGCRIGEAVAQLEHVVAIRRQVLRENDHFRLDSERDLAAAYLDYNKAGEAVDLLEHIVAVEEQLSDGDDSDRNLSHNLLHNAHDRLKVEAATSKTGGSCPEQDSP